jgi:hypothetical protein
LGPTPKKDSVNSWLAFSRAGVSAISTCPPPSDVDRATAAMRNHLARVSEHLLGTE